MLSHSTYKKIWDEQKKIMKRIFSEYSLFKIQHHHFFWGESPSVIFFAPSFMSVHA